MGQGLAQPTCGQATCGRWKFHENRANDRLEESDRIIAPGLLAKSVRKRAKFVFAETAYPGFSGHKVGGKRGREEDIEADLVGLVEKFVIVEQGGQIFDPVAGDPEEPELFKGQHPDAQRGLVNLRLGVKDIKGVAVRREGWSHRAQALEEGFFVGVEQRVGKLLDECERGALLELGGFELEVASQRVA